ncbi:MAG: DUF5123 domain-containing protein [Calditrichaeota bacterium]|nr:DUF5123 domain-containing protein [Calditrichota bacterium]MBT7787655.1 DUF5123 domain-containing protein [Calditrichota bacterium]
MKSSNSILTLLAAMMLIAPSFANAVVINVPEDFETIQGAIDESEDGDVVLVQPGEYVENINFRGRSITVASQFLIDGNEDHIENTIINGNGNGSVVILENNNGAGGAFLIGISIINGLSGNGGGGIHCEEATLTVFDCTISNNNTTHNGGGIWCSNSNITIDNCIITQNSASHCGGAVYVTVASLEITGSLISYNQDGSHGAAMEVLRGELIVRNCTIANNASRRPTMYMRIRNQSTGFFENCIFWGNAGVTLLQDRADISFLFADYERGRNSIVLIESELGWNDNNFEEDPLFVDPENGDFHLAENSPCIDAGDPESQEDPDGTRADMGAFYFHQPPIRNVSFEEGWNLISLNVSPAEEFYAEGEDRGPNVELMMEQLRIDEDNHHIELMKDGEGRFYAPAQDFNNIPYWNLLEGYLVKVDERVEANWEGEVIPADADIPLEAGWNLIAYLPTYELDASAPNFPVLAPIIDNVLIAKDAHGRFMFPELNFSNMPPWRETQGYQVDVNEDVVLNYPDE